MFFRDSDTLRRAAAIYRNNAHYALALVTLFLAVSGFIAMHHEMWRDEIQAWLLARDSTSIFQLFAHLKYEGHPGLWHLCLMPLTRITTSPIIMQVFHLIIAGATVYLFARYSPFNRLQKFLFSFGYFALYEYAILARNYALGLLLITIFCILFKKRYERLIWVGITLFCLAHTSVHALILTISISFVLMCEYLYRRRNETRIENSGGTWIGGALISIGILTAILQLNPPPDTGFAVAWKFEYDAAHLNKVTNLITRAYFPMPKAVMEFWNSHQLETYALFQAVQTPLCCLLILCSILLLLKRPTALFIYLIATLGLLSFFYIKYLGSMRHHGFLFLTLLLAIWIYRDCPEITLPFNRFAEAASRLLAPVFTVLLIFHFIGGITAARMDIYHVFSYGKQTAAYIQAQGMQEIPMVGESDSAVSTIVGYLQKKQIYYARGSRFGSFVRWDNARNHEGSDARVIEAAKTLRTQTSQDILIILNRALDTKLREQHRLIALTQFTGSIVDDEGFYLYLMQRP